MERLLPDEIDVIKVSLIQLAKAEKVQPQEMAYMLNLANKVEKMRNPGPILETPTPAKDKPKS